MGHSKNKVIYWTIAFLSTIGYYVHADEWGYEGEHGPPHWQDEYPGCSGTAQSPVDILTDMTFPDPTISMFQFQGYDQTLTDGNVFNNGHSVQLNFPSNKTFGLSGGGMSTGTYTALQLHFHWSSTGSSKGSEHTIDGKHFPVEMHIVHIKNPYTSVTQVKDMSDGLAVLGVLLTVKEGADDNPHFQKLFETASSCVYEGSEAIVTDGPRLISLLPDSGSFYRYSGSLTTPPCYQAVTWTVFQEPVVISEAQLEILQSLKSTTSSDEHTYKSDDCDDPQCHGKDKRETNEQEEIGGNFRPTQPLNGRLVSTFLDIGIHIEHEKGHWDYRTPPGDTPQWTKQYPTCAGNSQSPININSAQAKAPDAKDASGTTQKFDFKNYNSSLAGSVINNGHTVQLNINDDLGYAVSNGGLDGEYRALQLHFHWGELSPAGGVTGGAEHTLNDVRYAAEMHIVNAKTSYLSSLSDFQQNSSDAFAVLGIFVQVHENGSQKDSDAGSNPYMQMLIEAIEKVQFEGETTGFTSGPSLSSLLPDVLSFYRYPGSLTTPPCSESVVWSVFKQPITISVNQFIAFQRLFSVAESDVLQAETIRKMNTDYTLEDEGKMESHVDMDTTNGTSLLGRLAASLFDSHEKESKAMVVVESGNATEIYLIRNNYRPLQELNERAIYFYDYDVTVTEPKKGSSVLAIVLFSLAGLAVFVFMTMLAMRCCCKGEKKKSQYTAGSRKYDDAANL